MTECQIATALGGLCDTEVQLRTIMLQVKGLIETSPLPSTDQNVILDSLQLLFDDFNEVIKPIRISYADRLHDLLHNV